MEENWSSCDPTIAPDGDGSTQSALPGMSHTPAKPAYGGDDKTFPIISNFRVVRMIGRGAMGRVYEALQENVQGRIVAVKVMSAGVRDDQARALFKSEILHSSKFTHPHIVQIYDAGVTSDGRDFYAMELVKGATALDVHSCGRDVVREDLLKLFIEVARAVGHAHANETIHCDLKPANILVDRDGHPHVLDFGLAMAVRSQQAETPDAKTGGSPFGSWPYMSPEQANGDQRNLMPATDVYSLGVTLYELLTGKFPYEFESGSTSKQKAALIANCPIRWDPLIKLDFEMMAIIKKAMAKKPKERYATGKELAEDLDNYLADRPVLALWPHSTTYLLGKLSRQYRWRLLAAAMVLVMLVSVVTFFYLQVLRERDLARTNARTADIRTAEDYVFEGNALGSSREWDQAKERYKMAHDLFVSTDTSPFTADVGMWNAFRSSPPPLAEIPGDKGGIMDLAVSSDGRQAVTAANNGEIRLWDMTTKGWRVIRGKGTAMTSVALSPDGRMALAGAADGKASLLDLATGYIVWNIGMPDVEVIHVAVGSNVAVTVSGDLLNGDINDTLTFLDLKTGHPKFAKSGVGRIANAVFSADGTKLATVGTEVAVWDTKTGDKLQEIKSVGDTACAAFSPNGNTLLTGGGDGWVREWTLGSGVESPLFVSEGGGVSAVTFCRAGRLVLSCGNDGTLQIWDKMGNRVSRRVGRAQRHVQAAAFSADGRFAVCADSRLESSPPGDQMLSLWDLLPPAEAQDVATVEAPIQAAYILRSGPMALTCSAAGIALWDLPTGQKLDSHFDSVASVDCAVLSGDGRTLAIHHGDQLDVLNAAGLPWQMEATLTVPRMAGMPAILALSPDGSRFLAPRAHGALSLRQSTTGHELCVLSVQWTEASDSPFFTAAAISPDGRRALTAGRDHAVRLWDLSSGAEILPAMRGHQDAVNALAFSPDGSRAFSAAGNRTTEGGSDDFSIREWDLSNGQELLNIKEHTAPVRALAVDPSGTVLVSASDDKTVRFWNTADGQALCELETRDSAAASLAFSVEGDRLIVGGDDGSIRLMDFNVPGRRAEVESNPAPRFSLFGLDDWAVDQMSRDQAELGPNQFLELARSQWRLNHFDEAIAAMDRAGGAAPKAYMLLCLERLKAEQTGDAQHGEKK